MVNASAVASNQANNARGFRNLSRSQLGGVIFGCKNNTMRECLSKQLFGQLFGHSIFPSKKRKREKRRRNKSELLCRDMRVFFMFHFLISSFYHYSSMLMFKNF